MSTHRIAIIGTGPRRLSVQFFSDLPDNHAAAVTQHPSCELGRRRQPGARKTRRLWRALRRRGTLPRLSANARRGPARHLHRRHPPRTPRRNGHCLRPSHLDPSHHLRKADGPFAGGMRPDDRGLPSRGTCSCRSTTTAAGIPSGPSPKTLLDAGAIGEFNHIYCYMDGGKPAPWWRSENEGPLLHDFTHYF